MSLQEIMFKRAALHFGNELGQSDNIGQGIASMADSVFKAIQKQQAQRDAEKKSEADFNKAIARTKIINEGKNLDVSYSVGPKGGFTSTSKTKTAKDNGLIKSFRTLQNDTAKTGGETTITENGVVREKTSQELLDTITERKQLSQGNDRLDQILRTEKLISELGNIRDKNLLNDAAKSYVNNEITMEEFAKVKGNTPGFIQDTIETAMIGGAKPGQPQVSNGGEMVVPTVDGKREPAFGEPIENVDVAKWRTKTRNAITKLPLTEERIPTDKELFDEKMATAAEEMQKEVTQGVSGEVAGRISLSKEALKSVAKAKKLLFPKGKDGGLDRPAALASNIPLSTAPLIGRIIPDKLPALGGLVGDLDTKSQNLFRLLGSSYVGRILIQSGVAVREEEYGRLISQFAPSVFSTSESAWDSLQQLEDFYGDFLKTADPETRFPKQSNFIKGVAGTKKNNDALRKELEEINNLLKKRK